MAKLIELMENGKKIGSVGLSNNVEYPATFISEALSNFDFYGVRTTDIDGLKYDFQTGEELIIEEKLLNKFDDFMKGNNEQYKVLEAKYLKHDDTSIAIVRKNGQIMTEVIIFFSSGNYAHLKVRDFVGIDLEQTTKTLFSLWNFEKLEKKKPLKSFKETLADPNRKLDVEIQQETSGKLKLAYTL